MVSPVGRVLPFNDYNINSRLPLYEGILPASVNPTPPLQTTRISYTACRLREDCSRCPYAKIGSPFTCNVPTLSVKTNTLLPLEILQAHHTDYPALCCSHTVT